MSFRERMTAETGAPMPRWLYLLLKPVETLAGGVALAAVTGWPALWTTQGVALFYVGVGLWAWYRHRRVVLTTAPGQFVGDGFYHWILSQSAICFVSGEAPVVRAACFVGFVALWWVLEGMGYGVVRSPGAP